MTAAALAEQVQAAGRAAMYGLLAVGFATPSSDRWQGITERLLPACRSLELPEPAGAVLEEVGAAAPDHPAELTPAHLELFPPIASQDVPGHETAYRGEDLFRQVELLADVAGFYRAHGVRSGGLERERPDHIVVELEFMSFSARKELRAWIEQRRPEAEMCRSISEAFLRDHLACWAPAFGRRAERLASHPWYRALGALLATWIEMDSAGLEAVPVESAGEPLPQQPPDDGACGACPVADGGWVR